MKILRLSNYLIITKRFNRSRTKSNTLVTSLLVSLLLVTSNLSLANQPNNSNKPDPCGAELCLSGAGLASGIKECKVHIKKFFSITGTGKHGIFLPGVTYTKRYKWLNQCKSGNKAFKTMIMNTYGHLPSYPF